MRKGLQGALGLTLPVGGFKLEIKIKRRRPLRTIEGGSRRHGDRGSCWALPLLVAHEIGYARVFELGLWQSLLSVGIGAATQSYNGMPDLATWTPTRRSHQAASRSQARAVG